MKYDNIETVKRLDFNRLDTMVSERIGALKLLAQGMTDREVNDEICRDLILPCVYALAQFIESVQIEELVTPTVKNSLTVQAIIFPAAS